VSASRVITYQPSRGTAEPKLRTFGPWRVSPPYRGQMIRDDVARIVRETDGDWFGPVYEYLEQREVPPCVRAQFYDHAREIAGLKEQACK